MYYIPDLLTRRSKGFLSRCWLAAIFSEYNFKKLCNSRELLAISIVSSCEEIQKYITNEHKSGTRFSLYLSSQLAYGVIKAHLYQTKDLEETLRSMKSAMLLPSTKKSDKKSKILKDSIDLSSVGIPNLPELTIPLLINTQYRDRHLISESDYNYYDMDAESGDERWGFDRMNSDDVIALIRGSLFAESETLDKTRELPRDNIDPDVYAGDDVLIGPVRLPLADVNSRNIRDESILRTPTKRRAPTDNVDTPSKRRRNLRASLENQENILPVELMEEQLPNQSETVDITPAMPIVDDYNSQGLREMSSLIAGAFPRPESEIEEVMQQSQSNISTQVNDKNAATQSLQDSLEMILPPLALDELLPHQKNKKHPKFIDAETMISGEEMRYQIKYVHSTTVTIAKSRVNIDRIRLDSQLLFKAPSTIWRPNSMCHWSNKLEILFLAHIQGPFYVDYDKSLYVELLRHRDATEKTAELSDSINERHVTVPELSNKSVTEILANIGGDPHAEIDNEIINFGDVSTVEHPMPDSALMSTSVRNEMSTIPTVDTEPVKNSTRSSNSSDFLPPNFEKESVPVKQSTSSNENIIDVNNIRLSSRSKSHSISPILSPEWTTGTLLNELKRRWDENPTPIKFGDIYPPLTTSKFDASSGLFDILYLTKKNRIRIDQEESYATIWIHFNLI